MMDLSAKALRPPTEYLLLSKGGPYCSVRVVRQAWIRPSGQLGTLSFAGPAKLCRRALDSLLNPELIAVGQLKAWVETNNEPSQWVVEMRLVTCGATEVELHEAFHVRPRQTDSVVGDVARVDAITDVLKAVRRALSVAKARSWKGLWSDGDPAAPKPDRLHRREYELWHAALTPEAGIFRYGCDRYMKPLEKSPRVVKPPKPKKGHPDPIWLERHQFGKS